jgi:hypothetical protein
MDTIDPTLSPTAQWAAVSGFFMPLIIAVINRCHWSTEFKSCIAFMACVACTAVQLGMQQKLDFANFFPTLLLVLTFSISSFQGLWKPSGIANALEAATDGTARSTARDALRDVFDREAD